MSIIILGSLIGLFDKIVSIKTHEERHVYDLMIENSHNFIANGIIAHNTYISDNVSLADNLTVGENALYVDSSAGRVGIGTASLIVKFYAVDSISDYLVWVKVAGGISGTSYTAVFEDYAGTGTFVFSANGEACPLKEQKGGVARKHKKYKLKNNNQ
ncbi:MAG: hypothetical protein Q8N77_00370 [Nanoarchaeota archaeon]|nr:hypothetical protein [Nanoarchaeota archaeon]